MMYARLGKIGLKLDPKENSKPKPDFFIQHKNNLTHDLTFFSFFFFPDKDWVNPYNLWLNIL